MIRGLVLSLALLLAACSQGPAQPRFIAEGLPETLSDWGMLAARDGRLTLASGVEPYELNTPLFTDYAGKLRTIWMPKGSAANYEAEAAFDFPVGTVITKTFFYPRAAGEAVAPGDGLSIGETAGGLDLSRMRLIETRVLVRRADGWIALPYVWNDAQTEAKLKRTGQAIPLTLVRAGREDRFVYQVPNVNQCVGCHGTDHATKKLHPIGPKARHLNRVVTIGGETRNQLDRLALVGYLKGLPVERPRAADWRDETASLDDRARAWLDINCGHCHSATGPADTSGLYLTASTPVGAALGLCKPPIAAGQGTGGFNVDILPGDPDRSIMVFRTGSTDPGAMMPELGRSLAHEEGLALLRRWIAAMPGGCR